jgi:hypothetical protein
MDAGGERREGLDSLNLIRLNLLRHLKGPLYLIRCFPQLLRIFVWYKCSVAA